METGIDSAMVANLLCDIPHSWVRELDHGFAMNCCPFHLPWQLASFQECRDDCP